MAHGTSGQTGVGVIPHFHVRKRTKRRHVPSRPMTVLIVRGSPSWNDHVTPYRKQELVYIYYIYDLVNRIVAVFHITYIYIYIYMYIYR
jgi:hypothetical protein